MQINSDVNVLFFPIGTLFTLIVQIDNQAILVRGIQMQSCNQVDQNWDTGWIWTSKIKLNVKRIHHTSVVLQVHNISKKFEMIQFTVLLTRFLSD